MKEILQNKITWYIVGFIVLVALIWYIVSEMNEETKITIEPTGLPNTTDWGAGLNDTQAQLIRNYSVKLHTDMDGVNVFGWDNDLYSDFMAENDTIVTGVYNDFNSMYAHEENGTLTQWLQDENAYFGGTIDRLTGLNLL